MSSDENPLFNSTKDRVEDEIEEIWNELVENMVDWGYPPTDHTSIEDFSADDELIGEKRLDGETAEMEKRLDGFADSLWQLYERIGEFTMRSSESEAFAVYSTTMMVLGDWEEVERLVQSDAGKGSKQKMQSSVNWITNKLGTLSNKILNLLSTVTSLDGWELSGNLSGNVPGFAKGGVSLTLKFS